MKKLLLLLILSFAFVLYGCGNNTNTNDHSESTDIQNEQEENGEDGNNLNEVEANNDEENWNDGEDSEKNNETTSEEKGDLFLQVLKVDEEDGLTLDNNEFYEALSEVIAEDPQMGDADDFSIYPYSIVDNADGTSSALFLLINRLDKPIKNLVFDFTYGNKNGEYVYEGVMVDLPEEHMGVLEVDGVVPLLLEIDPEDEDLFLSIELEDIVLELDNVGIDFEE